MAIRRRFLRKNGFLPVLVGTLSSEPALLAITAIHAIVTSGQVSVEELRQLGALAAASLAEEQECRARGVRAQNFLAVS